MLMTMMLLTHVASASVALVLGAALLARNKRLPFHTRFGDVYHWTMLIVGVSAILISVLRGRAVVFTYLAPPSYALALLGYTAAKRRWRGWLRLHITGQTGSYVALLTGLAVQSVPDLIPREFVLAHRQLVLWTVLLAPGVIAAPFIARTQARWRRRPPVTQSIAA